MNISALVAELETIPGLAGHVYVSEPQKMQHVGTSPYVWISSINESGDESPVVGPVRQRINVTIELMIGTLDMAAMDAIRSDIQHVLLNFQAGNGCIPMSFGSGGFDFADPGWVVWRETYETAYWVDTFVQKYVR